MATATMTTTAPDLAPAGDRPDDRAARLDRFDAWRASGTNRELVAVAAGLRELAARVRAVRASRAFGREAGEFLRGRGRAAPWRDELLAAALSIDWAVCLIETHTID